MRSAPTLTSNVVAVIPSGTVVPVLGTSADLAFVQVSYNGTTGWVAARFVRLGAASAPATGVTAVTLADLRLHSTPVLNLTNVVSTVPFGTVVPVLGRSADNQLVKISYNGLRPMPRKEPSRIAAGQRREEDMEVTDETKQVDIETAKG